MVLNCPNCDSILAGGRCQACGWKIGESVSRNFSANPLNQSKCYPGYETKASGAESMAEESGKPEQPQAPNVSPISEPSESMKILAEFQAAHQKVQ